MAEVNEKEFLIRELEYVLDLLKNTPGVSHTEFNGGLEYETMNGGYGRIVKGHYAEYKMNMRFTIPTPKKEYKQMATKTEYKEALAEMVKWFGKYPEMIPAPECFDKYKAAIDNAEKLLEEQK